MSNATNLKSENYRMLAFGDLTTSFVDLGTPTEHAAAIVIAKNTSDAFVEMTWDGGATVGFGLAPSNNDSIDVSSNGASNIGFLPRYSQFQARYVGSAPTDGAVIVQLYYFGS